MPNVHIPKLQEFLSIAKRYGFARTDRFLTEFYPQNRQLLGGNQMMSLMCEDAVFPGKTIGVRTLRINTINEQRAHTVDYTGNSIQFRFVVDTTWSARLFFENWLAVAVPPMQRHSSREVGFYNDYIGTVNIYSLVPVNEGIGGNAESPIFGISLKEAWPTAIHAQPMSSGMQGFHHLTVDFTFKWWENLGNVAQSSIPDNDNSLEHITQFGKR